MFGDALEVVGALVKEMIDDVPVVCEGSFNSGGVQVVKEGVEGTSEGGRECAIRMGGFIPCLEYL